MSVQDFLYFLYVWDKEKLISFESFRRCRTLKLNWDEPIESISFYKEKSYKIELELFLSFQGSKLEEKERKFLLRMETCDQNPRVDSIS